VRGRALGMELDGLHDVFVTRRVVGEQTVRRRILIEILGKQEVHTDRSRARLGERGEQHGVLVSRHRPSSVGADGRIVDSDDRDRFRGHALTTQSEPPVQHAQVERFEGASHMENGEQERHEDGNHHSSSDLLPA